MRKMVIGSREALLKIGSVAVSDVCNAVAIITNLIDQMNYCVSLRCETVFI